MPTVAKPKPAPKPAAKPAVVEREIVYPIREAVFRDADSTLGPLTCAEMKDLMGWETESDYKARRTADGATEKEIAKELLSVVWLLKDRNGERVVCHNNWGNRHFDLAVCEGYVQDILNRKWAGPTTYPGETVNGEAVVVGRTGRTISLQKRGVAHILACQDWAGPQAAHWATLWPEEPVFECLLVTGVSEDPRIVQTVDNVQTRTEADVIETSDFWPEQTDPHTKRELSRMLAKAVEFLWLRTRAGYNAEGKKSQFHSCRTRSTMMSFLRGHAEHLRQAIKHVYAQNKESKDPADPKLKVRAISNLNLSPGECAGMMYLMGASATDEADAGMYREVDERAEAWEVPGGKKHKLDWGNWDAAKQFWAQLARDDKVLKPLKQALVDLAKGEEGVEPAKAPHKHQTFAKAWLAYLGDGVTEEALELEYKTNTEGIEKLADDTTFGGIDLGPKLGSRAGSGEEEDEDAEVVERVNGERKKTPAQKLLDRAEADKARKEAEQKGTSPSIAEPGSPDGKPPAPKLLPQPANKRLTQAEVTKAQTERARKADEELAIEAGAAEELNRQHVKETKANVAANKSAAKNGRKAPPKPAGKPAAKK